VSASEPLDPAQPAVEPAAEAAAVPVTEPTPTVGAGDATWSQPAGSALLDGAPVDPHPEKQVGKAFAGGLVAAIVLGRLAKRRHAR
jgi:hypothetical protein